MFTPKKVVSVARKCGCTPYVFVVGSYPLDFDNHNDYLALQFELKKWA